MEKKVFNMNEIIHTCNIILLAGLVIIGLWNLLIGKKRTEKMMEPDDMEEDYIKESYIFDGIDDDLETDEYRNTYRGSYFEREEPGTHRKYVADILNESMSEDELKEQLNAKECRRCFDYE